MLSGRYRFLILLASTKSARAFSAKLLVGMTSCFALLWTLQVEQCMGDDWPHWNGPTRDGTWNEAGILDAFPETGPKVLWRSKINLGYSGPAVAEGRIFVMDRIEDRQAKPKEKGSIVGNERCLCLDSRTGETLWSHEYECDYHISYPEGPRTTPSVAGNQVYFLGAMGRLACHDVGTGKVLWEKELTQIYSTKPPAWGFAIHPLVDGDRLYCIVGGEGSAIVCLNRMDGSEIWKTHTAQEIGYAPPVLYEKNGTRQLIHWHDTGLISVDPANGTTLWQHEFPKHAPSRPVVCISTPRIHGDQLLISDFYNGSMLLQLNTNPPSATEVWCSNPKDQQHENDLNSLMGTVVIEEDCIYGIAGNGEMRCLSLNDQSLLWRDAAPSSSKERNAFFATSFMVKNGNRHFLFNDQGYLKIVQLNPEGYQETSSAQIIKPTGFARGREVVWSHPAFAEGKLFVRNTEEIVCFEMTKG